MASDFPSDCRYADSHEYVRPEGGRLRLGLSAFAIDQLGDIVFVELPEVGIPAHCGPELWQCRIGESGGRPAVADHRGCRGQE